MDQFVSSALDELCTSTEGSNGGRMGRRKHNDDSEFKSPNLLAERRRRQKLSDRLLKLRGLVPIITNMNKATIIEDAITYINELQQTVDTLTNLLSDKETSSEDGAQPRKEVIPSAQDSALGMMTSGVQAEINVTQIIGNKLWIKLVFEKKREGFTKLVEAMNASGLQLTDTSVTTSKGAMLVTSCVEGFHCGVLAAEETKKLLLQIINGIQSK